MKKILTTLLFIVTCFLSAQSISARSKELFGLSKTKSPKAAYEGYGKVSKSTGRIKTKRTRGYFKPSNGYKFVNPYSKS